MLDLKMNYSKVAFLLRIHQKALLWMDLLQGTCFVTMLVCTDVTIATRTLLQSLVHLIMLNKC